MRSEIFGSAPLVYFSLDIAGLYPCCGGASCTGAKWGGYLEAPAACWDFSGWAEQGEQCMHTGTYG